MCIPVAGLLPVSSPPEAFCSWGSSGPFPLSITAWRERACCCWAFISIHRSALSALFLGTHLLLFCFCFSTRLFRSDCFGFQLAHVSLQHAGSTLVVACGLQSQWPQKPRPEGSLVKAHGLSCPITCGILVLCARIELKAPPLEGRFSTTRLTGSPTAFVFTVINEIVMKSLLLWNPGHQIMVTVD